MIIIRSTHDILRHPWKINFSEQTQISGTKIPLSWQSPQEITLDDVTFWEQLYFQPGNMGIYVAWSPYAEFYMVVHNLYSYAARGILTFTGNSAHEQLQNYVIPLQINLTVRRVWTASAPLHQK